MENLTGGTPPVRYLPCVVPCKLYFTFISNTVQKQIREFTTLKDSVGKFFLCFTNYLYFTNTYLSQSDIMIQEFSIFIILLQNSITFFRCVIIIIAEFFFSFIRFLITIISEIVSNDEVGSSNIIKELSVSINILANASFCFCPPDK